MLSLIRNPAIIGRTRYGSQSEGRHRRFTPDGPRTLTDADVRPDGRPKVVFNPAESIIDAEAGFEPLVAPAAFDAANKLAANRGACQRGIPRSRDPARYPLSSRIYDLTNGCGHPMYGLTSGKRRIYVCGRYLKTAGSQCAHNPADGEATLVFVLGLLRQRVLAGGQRAAIRERLIAFARAEHERRPDRSAKLDHIRTELQAAEPELATISANLARAADEDA